MEDIYGDLENYNDVNALEELRNENEQLKFRIKEYASDMEKLQKEFDKVSSDFKTLEMNYSSLLRTAKAEIQRKTQIICNLNSEKDLMVLNSIQNSNKSILNIRRNLLGDKIHSTKVKMMKKDNELQCCKPMRKDLKKFDILKESSRKNPVRIPSVDTMTSVSTDECAENKLDKSDTYAKKSGTKENITKAKYLAQSIRNRRKSMPILGKPLPKFSSDEENDDNSADKSKRKDRYSRDEKPHRNPDRYTGKTIHKISETSGIDEKYSSYHESSRETFYRGNSSRQSDKHKSIRDKYEQPQRPRRQFTPERPNRKAPRDNSTDHYRDYRRHRVLESPPPDRLEVQKRNRRFNYERENRFEDKHCSPYEKLSISMKHKLSCDYEEPASKKIKTCTSNKNLVHEIKRNKNLTENAIPSNITDPLHLTSCISPDYIDPETSSPVKEIMSTADVQLEDPRLKSQKYVTHNENDKLVLCTVTGRNVKMKQIDSSTWDIVRVEVPEALKNPLQYENELVQQLYQDVDQPISCKTPESGEIRSDSEDVVTDSYFKDICKEENQRVRDLNISDNYDKNTNNTHNAYQTRDNTKQLDMPITEYVIDTAKQENKSDTKITIKLLSKKDNENKIQQRNSEHEQKEPMKHSGIEKISDREIVEGDLALSDETSDYIDAQIKIKDKCRTRSQHITSNNSIQNTSVINVQHKCAKERDISSTSKGEQSENHLAKRTKKAKSKKKAHKSKEKSADLMNTNAFNVDNTDEQQKPKKKTEKTGKIKEKFTDLFGDSCSLITPEDLGVSTMPVDKKYVPLFEDALDANDINLKDIAQPQKESKTKFDELLETKKEVSQKVESKDKKNSEKNDEKNFSVETPEWERETDKHTVMCQAVTKESNILSTVIISTGIQSQAPQEQNIEPLVDKRADINNIGEAKIDEHNEVLTNLQHLQPTALATSTPYKELPIKNIVPESDPVPVESTCNSNDSRMLRNGNATPSDLSSNISSQMENDAPDIRIIVRRRRKKW